MKRVGIFVEDRKFNDLGFKTFIETKRPDDVVQFVQIVESKPFDSQDPFDLIIHKSFHLLEKNKDKYAQFQNYVQSNPSTKFIDQMDAVNLILNRYEQFRGIANAIQSAGLIDDVIIPSFCQCTGNFDSDIQALHEAKLKFPAICKPLNSHGNADVHKMMLLFKEADLKLIRSDSVLQSFENHDGFLLKAYVIGDFLHLVVRPSITNLSKEHEPILFNSQDVSKENSRSNLNNSQSVPNINDLDVDKELIKRAVDALRTHLGLDLINIDFVVLSKADHKQRLAIIDVNIFPNYKCVPDFFFHLENLVREKLNLPKLTSPEIFKQ
ncbi:unnamed protein product [Hymenolepis diminuta]|uniref:Inositol-tetrakisphosphate 1-kinase n=1 Tax=Hymenolepis diminuta TaxID=6216 RepID=A0A564Z1A1_HYMDI|nr:unnamed protein product [Hymenolepis diminuta]